MADTESEVANLPADTLVTQIDRTRAELAQTIDAISDRLSPANIARRSTARIRERISQMDPLLGAAAATVVVAGMTAYFVWRRRRN
ncbi:MAG: DUF3618 domain-containing protein [Streptosporangiaceae bacterium]|nr:DUF3618 domain-containing protein [Streptosporangiaceae bacterium]MBV9855306.1 DUF3618 domain-containing protein [Streptosporangiaceae bacterium]